MKWFLHRRKPWRKLRTGLQNGGPTILPGWHWLFLGFENEHLNFALATPDGTFALRVRFSTTRYSLGYPSGSVRNDGTEYAAPLVKRQDIASEHGWIEVVESMTLSSAL